MRYFVLARQGQDFTFQLHLPAQMSVRYSLPPRQIKVSGYNMTKGWLNDAVVTFQKFDEQHFKNV